MTTPAATNQPGVLSYNDTSHVYMLDGRRLRSITAVAKIPTDTFTVEQWRMRQVALGLAIDPTLIEDVAAHRDDNHRVNDIVQKAMDVAGASNASRRGTQAHAASEYHDLDQPLITDQQRRDATVWQRTLDAYGIEVIPRFVEQIVLYPYDLVAGRTDRFAMMDGSMFDFDIKGLALDTPIPTPTGWSTIAALEVGDEVIGSDGRPCTITGKSEVRWRDCYRITFDDTTTVIADAEHRWIVDYGHSHRQTRQVMTTDELANASLTCRVPVTEPVVLPDADLPIDPYLLGCWLGDGNRGRGVIVKPRTSLIWQRLADRGHALGKEQVDPRTGCSTFTVHGLQAALRAMNLLGHKSIPDAYMRASITQRLDLLRGLMDADGTVNTKRKQAVFNSVDKVLALGVCELVLSLGERAIVSEIATHGFGKDVTVYAVTFRPTFNPFSSEKADRWTFARSTRGSHRVVRSVERIPTVATQCLSVDSPDHTYLCTEAFVPTHNTGTSAVRYPHGTATQLALHVNAPWIQCGSTIVDGLETVTQWEPLPEELRRDVAYVISMPTRDEGDVGTLYRFTLEGRYAGTVAAKMALVARHFQMNDGLCTRVNPPLRPAKSVPYTDADHAASIGQVIDLMADTMPVKAAFDATAPGAQQAIVDRIMGLADVDKARLRGMWQACELPSIGSVMPVDALVRAWELIDTVDPWLTVAPPPVEPPAEPVRSGRLFDKPDEGPLMPTDEVASLAEVYNRLPENCLVRIGDLSGEATRNGVDFHLATIQSARRTSLLRALITLAVNDCADDTSLRVLVSGVTGQPFDDGSDVGALVGSLDAAQAGEFARFAAAWVLGHVAAPVDERGVHTLSITNTQEQ